jgi:hypothetical protein
MSRHYLSFKNKYMGFSMVAYMCNPSTAEVEAGLRFGGQAGLQPIDTPSLKINKQKLKIYVIFIKTVS